MYRIQLSPRFEDWLLGLSDPTAQTLIASRIDRISKGHFRDVKPVGAGVMEARLHYGPGYRLYYTQRGREVVFLLAGGNKKSQARDIEWAIRHKADD